MNIYGWNMLKRIVFSYHYHKGPLIQMLRWAIYEILKSRAQAIVTAALTSAHISTQDDK